MPQAATTPAYNDGNELLTPEIYQKGYKKALQSTMQTDTKQLAGKFYFLCEFARR